MMKFACFERTVEAIYKYVVPKPRSECSKPEQLVVTFVGGYIGKLENGMFCWRRGCGLLKNNKIFSLIQFNAFYILIDMSDFT